MINAVLPLRLSPVTARRRCLSTPRFTSALSSFLSRFIAVLCCSEDQKKIIRKDMNVGARPLIINCPCCHRRANSIRCAAFTFGRSS
ncbi:Uncharacterised protein [Shigella sonnei]|nr:Uncharacterised protein [Shigella sonnei]